MSSTEKLDRIKAEVIQHVREGQFIEAKELINNEFKYSDDADIWDLKGYIHNKLGEDTTAIECYEYSLKLRPDYPELEHNVAYLCQQQGEYSLAIKHYEKAIYLNPAYTEAYNNLATLLASIKQYDKAIQAYHKIIELGAETPDILINLANAYNAVDNNQDAIIYYRQAIDRDDNVFIAHHNLASVYEKLHKLDEALVEIELALKINPEHSSSKIIKARIFRRLKKYDETKEIFEGLLLRSDLHPRESVVLHNELGHTLDRMGDYKGAFFNFSESNKKSAELLPSEMVDNTAYIDHVNNMLMHFDACKTDASNENYTADAISKKSLFIVGFPRSGTTLTEQIVVSKTGLVSSNEKPLIPQLMKEAVAKNEAQGDRELFLSKLDKEDMDLLQKRYWEMVDENYVLGDSRFVDKLPLNLVEMPFIYRLFPGAPIIVVIRDPRDACLSAYMQSFEQNYAMINFVDLKRTVDMYLSVMQAWKFYKNNLPLRVYEFRYEDLISNPEEITKEMFKFIGEEWTEDVLRFYEEAQSRYVKTPSYRDITSPIYKRSIGRWKNYSDFISSEFDRLLPVVEEFGYDIG